jgi:hypothetical protein
MEQLRFPWMGFHEIYIWVIFRKSVEKVQVSLKSDKNKGYCTCSPKYKYGHISNTSTQNYKLSEGISETETRFLN